MRLTNSILLRGYNRDLQRLKTEKNACEKKITSTRKFSRASEAPLSAAKALNVRKSQYYSEQYRENLNVAAKFYTEAETSLLQVSEKMAEIRETIIAAVNTTKDSVDYKIYAQQLETRAQELCAIFNTDSAGRAIFGGESDNSLPFSIINDSQGIPATVLYHNVPVNAMNDYRGYPYSNDVYMDIGLGMYTDQAAHTQDPMSVLNISFNGAKVTGCGAQYGVADIDLTSILENRQYVLDVYADGRKQTIAFLGKATQQENVQQINDLLADAYKKDKNYGRNVPAIDDQGVVYLQDANGNALQDGVVSIVNNTWSSSAKHAEQLIVDNDSNYTNKFKLKIDSIPENTSLNIEVELDGVKKEVTFMSGADDFSDPANPILREDTTIKNFQDALDQAFGTGKINVSDHYPNKGVVTSEGSVVKLWGEDPKIEGPQSNVGPKVTSKMVGTLDLASMTHDGNTQYIVRAEIDGTEYERTLTTGTSPGSTAANFFNLFNDVQLFSGADVDVTTGVFTYKTTVVNFVPTYGPNAAPVKTDYMPAAIDPGSLENGQEYQFKVIYGNNVKTITVTGGADREASLQNITDAIRAEFPDVYVGYNGEIVTPDKKDVGVVNTAMNRADFMPYERERIYSNNYIQLTLDAARALRNNDIEYANGCIDRIVTASENLLGQIADLGCNEDFIDFNLERLTTREENLAERQNELEITDPEYQITLWKTYEAYFNACLQMSSSVIPNSIFNYMK